MIQFRLAHLGLALAVVGITLAPPLMGLAPAAYAAESMRAEVAKPLAAASALGKSGKYKEALAKVREADAVGGKTGYESFMIDQMRASFATSAGDTELALRSYEAVLASGRLSAGDTLRYLEAVAGMHYRAKNYAKTITAIQRYQKEGGNSAQMRELLTQSYFLSNDCARATKDVQGEIRAAEKAGRTPAEGQLQLVANCASKQSDPTDYVAALEKLVTYYPKKDYWQDLMNRLPNKKGFSSRLGLDVFRLKHALGQINTIPNYMELTQLALQPGYAIEGKKYIEQGYASGVMGTGADAERQKRLRDLASKRAEDLQKEIGKLEAEAIKTKDAKAISDVGYNYVTLGQTDKGLALMEQALTTTGAKNPEDLKLHLALAYQQAGKTPKALATLKTVQGTDGTADIARYWAIQFTHPLK